MTARCTARSISRSITQLITTARSLVPALLVLSAGLVPAGCTDDTPEAPPYAVEPTPAPTPVVTKVEAPGTYEVRYYVLDKSCPYCRDLKRVMVGGGTEPGTEPTLESMYAGKVKFVIKPGFDDKGDPVAETVQFGFGGAAHGFAGIAPDGTVKFTSPGHHQSRGELVTLIDTMLK